MIVISNDFFLFQQVRAQALGSFHGLVEFPLANLGFVATEQNLRNLPSLVVGRTGVDRGGKNVVLKQSESALCSSLITPGTSRMTASEMMAAASSPPVST